MNLKVGVGAGIPRHALGNVNPVYRKRHSLPESGSMEGQTFFLNKCSMGPDSPYRG